MAFFWLVAGLLLALTAAAVAAHRFVLRPRGYDRWLAPYIAQTGKRRPPPSDRDIHVLLCIADHYEPKAQRGVSQGHARVARWVTEFPRRFVRFRDSSGRPPRHTFFFPIEEYEPGYLDALAGLCRQGFGEVEVHLHHDGATESQLRADLAAFRDLLTTRHKLLSRRKDTGEIGYAFIHGNWALCNSRPDGRCCGVNNEIDIAATGCFADFTFPSAPSATQPPTINSMYYASNVPGRPRSADHGLPIGTAPMPQKSLLIIQGPLLLDWKRRKWGVAPRLENGCLQASQPPSLERLDAWLRARVQAPGRPDWHFVKLHAHGAPEDAHDVLLGEPMTRFHEALAARARANPRFHYHYVTAREMYNLAKAAEAGFQGPVAEALDFLFVSNARDSAPVLAGQGGRKYKKRMPAPAGFSWIDKPLLAAMARPEELDEFTWLREQGIQLLIALSESPPRRDFTNEAGLLVLHVPVEDMHPPSDKQIELCMSAIQKAHTQDMAVGVHCTAGLGRTGVIVACYLIDQGISAKNAIARIRRLRPGSVETDEQADAIAEYARRQRASEETEGPS